MNRQIQTLNVKMTTERLDGAFGADLAAWMVAWAGRYGCQYLLAHTVDAVIWGRFKSGGLELANPLFDEIKADLSAETLQQARLFGINAEILVWKDDVGWMMRVVRDGEGEPQDTFEDQYWLWGTRGELGREADGFTLLVEGKQGLRHAPPIAGLGSEDRVALRVRHYIGDDDTEGQARIETSRLVSVEPVTRGGTR